VLDIVQIHHDIGDVAGEQDALAVCRDVEVFGYVGAVEEERVDAVATLDYVAAIARIPLKGVFAGTE